MAGIDLILLTNSFPVKDTQDETWLVEEIAQTFSRYRKIIIVPFNTSKDYRYLPQNCEVLDISKSNQIQLSLAEFFDVIRIVFSNFASLQKNFLFYRNFRYNFSLIKKYYKDAKNISNAVRNKLVKGNKVILYAYWADHLATCICIIKKKNPHYKVVARGHGFEIFEEQTKYGVVLYRKFQLKYIDKLFADSYRGYLHLKEKHPTHINQFSYSYIGTKDFGSNPFSDHQEFSIVTCSFIRNIKRLHLLPEILKHISYPITWHVIGNGPDLESLKKLCTDLPKNVRVNFLGYLTPGQINEFYSETPVNLYVSLSQSEGLPVTMMEAISYGIPILSTDVGGCNEICNEKTGLLIERDFKPGEVAQSIAKFKNSHQNSTEGRKKVRLFWKEMFFSETNYNKFVKSLEAL